jgi:hypothetical protein
MVLAENICPRRDEIIVWRELHNEELHNLYSLPSISRMMKSRRMGWTGYAGCMEEECIWGFWWEKQDERDH